MTRTPPPLALSLALFALAMLAGCDSAFAPKAGPTASGEVLPGTVSDAMLDTDRSQAEAPLAPTAPSAASKDDKPMAASDAAADTSAPTEGPAPDTDAPAKPAPAASPKPAQP